MRFDIWISEQSFAQGVKFYVEKLDLNVASIAQRPHWYSQAGLFIKPTVL